MKKVLIGVVVMTLTMLMILCIEPIGSWDDEWTELANEWPSVQNAAISNSILVQPLKHLMNDFLLN